MISMRPDSKRTKDFLAVAKKLAGFPVVEVSPAVNGNDVPRASLPLYTQYLMLHGRSAHQEVSTPGMVGCYLSHVAVLEKLKPGDVFAVFEEDATFVSGPTPSRPCTDFWFRSLG